MTYTTNRTYQSRSADETRQVAITLAAELHGGQFISLIGDLGAGKTTFTQGLVVALGSTARVKSPTFTVMNEYPVPDHPTIRRVVHCDFYRFTKAAELGALELDEYRQPDTIIIAEWPNILPDVEWKPDITITFVHTGDDGRTIVVEGVG